jgi:activating signal cointegrator 1
VILGAKLYETRSWNTSHRGRLAIHASRSFSEQLARLCLHEPFRSALRGAGYRDGWDLPRGVILGSVELVEVHATDELDPRSLSATELAFGDFRPRRFAFQLANPKRCDPPLKMTGQLNIFEIDLEV